MTEAAIYNDPNKLSSTALPPPIVPKRPIFNRLLVSMMFSMVNIDCLTKFWPNY